MKYNKKLGVFMNSGNCGLTMIKKFTLLELGNDVVQSPCYFCQYVLSREGLCQMAMRMVHPDTTYKASKSQLPRLDTELCVEAPYKD